jgi:3-oxoacyl-(acyl-carrier-protein) synthase
MRDDWVISGIGALCASGQDHASLLAALQNRSVLPSTSGREQEAGPRAGITHTARDAGPSRGVALLATALAAAAADARLDEQSREDVGLVLATAYGNLNSIIQLASQTLRSGARFVNPGRFPYTVVSTGAGYAARPLGFTGPCTTITAGDASGSAALDLARLLLCQGSAETIFVVGYEEYVPALGISYGSEIAPAMLPLPATVRKGSADEASLGIPMGEAAAALCLEAASRARARGAPIYATLSGASYTPLSRRGEPGARSAYPTGDPERLLIGSKCDTWIAAITAALDDAGCAPNDISLIFSAASAPGADPAEAAALYAIFGQAGGNRWSRGSARLQPARCSAGFQPTLMECQHDQIHAAVCHAGVVLMKHHYDEGEDLLMPPIYYPATLWGRTIGVHGLLATAVAALLLNAVAQGQLSGFTHRSVKATEELGNNGRMAALIGDGGADGVAALVLRTSIALDDGC